MKLALNIIAVLLLVVGGVWILQGADVLGGSSMSGQTQWLVIGIVAAIAGIGLLVFATRWQKRE